MSRLQSNLDLLNTQSDNDDLPSPLSPSYIRSLKSRRKMSQHVPQPNGAKRAAPIKARRGGISLGGRRQLSQSELFRQPGAVQFASHPQSRPCLLSMDTHNTPTKPTLVAPDILNSVSASQPNAAAQPESSRNSSPEADLEGESLDEKAQALLHQFLCTSSTKSSNEVDSGTGPEPSYMHVQPSNGLKRTADGQVKQAASHGKGPSYETKEIGDSRSDLTQSGIIHPNKGLPGTSLGPQSSSGVKNTTTAATTPNIRLHSPARSTPPVSATHSQNDAQNPENKQYSTTNPIINSYYNASNISNTQSDPPSLPATFPSSSSSLAVVVRPYPTDSEFIKPGLPASSTSLSTKHTEKPPKNNLGPKPKNKALAMPHSDSGSGYYQSDSASHTTVVRRPRRSRAAPVNYYAKVRGFLGYQSDEDGEEAGEEQENPSEVNAPRDDTTHQSPYEELTPVPEPAASLIRSVYRAGYLQVQQEPLPAPVDEIFEEYAPYSSLHARIGYGERCTNEHFELDDPDGRVIHADFDQSEMEGLFRVMTGQPANESDIAIPDLLAQVTQKFYPHRDQQKALAQKISDLNALHKSLLRITDDPTAFLLHHRDRESSWRECDNETPQRGTIRQILSYLHIVLGLPEPANRVYHVHDILQRVRQTNNGDFQHLISVLNCFKHRRKRHICAFLYDAANGLVSSAPYILRALSSHADYPSPDFDCMRPSALLRERELGQRVFRRKTPINQKLQSRRGLELWKRWKGASNDVMVLAWSPDGTRFAAGAAAQSDEHNMIYNRNNNLLLGDLTCNSLKELPDHRICRPVPSNVTDPSLYMTVSAVSWRGDSLYTASFDNTVKIWDVSTHAGAKCVNTLLHDGRVMDMAVSRSGFIATGCDSSPHIKLWTQTGGQDYTVTDLTCNPTKNVAMTPSSLAWGPTSADNILVAGLAAREDEKFRNGHLALWQVGQSDVSPLIISPNSQNVFDVTWHPTAPIFATGSTVELSVSAVGRAKTIRSLVRVYDPFRPTANWGAHITYECPALDINDVTFCPANSNYITASCTDGATYVWDYRNPGQILHKLAHGAPIAEQDPNVSREKHDIGVRVALWKDNFIDQFYTGGSDGVLKKWNILRAPEDVLVENTAHFDQGIMSGAFSPDFTNLLVGDSCGSIHVLSSAPFSHGGTNMAYEPASKERPSEDDDRLGIETAKELLESGKLSRHPVFGVGQGPRYDGPFAAWARQAGTPKEALPHTPLLPEIRATQLDRSLNLRHQLEREDEKQLDARILGAIAQNKQRGRNKRKVPEDVGRRYNNIFPFSRSSSYSSSLSPLSYSRLGSLSPSIFVSHKHSDKTHQYISLLSDDESGPSSSSAPPCCPARIKSEFSSTSKPAFPPCIDLTGDSSEDEAARHQQQQGKSHGALSLDDEDVDSLCEPLDDDYWWPRNCDVDPNIRRDEA
ncbi:WD repeat protein [Blastomyces gilchristii SLH14081]|uniref:WD repeat protein n=1 Tax=Blastomyces gilchristii (strain SLH14081) TaxID=559298 RepID=A0A179V3V2_BLAGS|nr:WD repeat protein [Blastomyces gilchristii SLH14081]OAT14119.1 WD repeat protein [Blastomyces gilchristii SLH14081]